MYYTYYVDLSYYILCNFLGITYPSRDEKTREQVPDAYEEGHNNGSNLVARSQSYYHHPIQCVVYKAHQDKEVKPQELFKLPMESNH